MGPSAKEIDLCRRDDFGPWLQMHRLKLAIDDFNRPVTSLPKLCDVRFDIQNFFKKRHFDFTKQD